MPGLGFWAGPHGGSGVVHVVKRLPSIDPLVSRAAVEGVSMVSHRFCPLSMAVPIALPLDELKLRQLFTKPYGVAAPDDQQWRDLYAPDVHFEDPTQKRCGINSFIKAQQDLVLRCDDVFLEAGAVVINGDQGFVEWRMGLKIKGIEFVYPGVTRLLFGSDGRIVDHRDYFDFVGPTFEPVPVIGGFVRWVYRRFVA